MKASFLISALLLIFGVALAEQPSKRKPDPEAGKDLYMRSCWQCHGREADGAGPASPALNVAVPSLRNKVSKDSISKMITVVQDGRGAMPNFSETITYTDTRRIFIYIQSLDSSDSPEQNVEEDEPEVIGDGNDGNEME